MPRWTCKNTLQVLADDTPVVSHAGSPLLVELADRLGLTDSLSAAMAPTRQRPSAHDPGRVVRDLAVMLTDGGDCLADLGALRDQVDLHGAVASDSTAWCVIAAIDAGEALAGVLRPGNADANTAADHIGVLVDALDQLPSEVPEVECGHANLCSPARKTALPIESTLPTPQEVAH